METNVINEKVTYALKSVGLSGYENRKIQELSGGQQQRVSLARSLVKNAKILLLDEPLVNLDYKLREQLREEFKNLFSKGLADETILIYSTTDPRETMELNGEVIVLDEGKVLQVGPAKEIFENPNSLKVAEISNDPPMNIIDAEILESEVSFEGISISAPKHFNNINNKSFKIGLRSSDIILNEKGYEFEVELAEISGSETLLHLKKGNTKLIMSIEEVMNFKIHDKVKINFKIEKAYAFNSNGDLASSPFRSKNG
jgi:glycerol transport system ATP-binding protein